MPQKAGMGFINTRYAMLLFLKVMVFSKTRLYLQD